MEQIDSPRLHFLSANPRRNPAVDDHFWQVTIIRAKNQIRNSLKCNRITGFVSKKRRPCRTGRKLLLCRDREVFAFRLSSRPCGCEFRPQQQKLYRRNRNAAATSGWLRLRATRLRTATKKTAPACGGFRKFIMSQDIQHFPSHVSGTRFFLLYTDDRRPA